jgi:hypothetical protein
MFRTLAVTAALGLAALTTPVHAGTVTYNFAGTCTDCAGAVTAQLVVEDYTAGQELRIPNLVSFSYGGSNLVSSFTSVPTDQIAAFEGVLPSDLPGAAIVYISDLTLRLAFSSLDNGTWSVSSVGGSGNFNDPNVSIDDIGTQGVWTVAADTMPSGVPEPASMALMFLPGFLVLSRLRNRPDVQPGPGASVV